MTSSTPARPDGPPSASGSGRAPRQYEPGTGVPLWPAAPVGDEDDPGQSGGHGDGGAGDEDDTGDDEYVPL
jgi:hypothetical protein